MLQPLKDFLRRLFGKSQGKPKQRPAPAKTKPKQAPGGGPAPQEFAFSLKAPAPAAKPQVKTQAKPHGPSEDVQATDLDVKSGSEKKEKRKAFRVSIRGVDVACAELNARCPGLDLSATGIGFQYQGPRVKGGTILTLDLRLAGKLLAQQIPAKVMRHEGGVLGCSFLPLNRLQEDAVGKIVVGVQRGTLFHTVGVKPQAAPTKPQAAPVKPGATAAKPQAASAKPAAKPVTPGATRK